MNLKENSKVIIIREGKLQTLEYRGIRALDSEISLEFHNSASNLIELISGINVRREALPGIEFRSQRVKREKKEERGKKKVLPSSLLLPHSSFFTPPSSFFIPQVSSLLNSDSRLPNSEF